ncbi:hypothetical protein ANCDUO_22734 [Ancylostoma duodenale]|uniref:Uncharacterized protein n=1 Tax=Ancylostoma duodenale TaxID=51022 RepID=A0A0C2CBI5_9BILA|nr:hypothetical protein ANCDUO_22734 [Ancylostoma duodenale]
MLLRSIGLHGWLTVEKGGSWHRLGRLAAELVGGGGRWRQKASSSIARAFVGDVGTLPVAQQLIVAESTTNACDLAVVPVIRFQAFQAQAQLASLNRPGYRIRALATATRIMRVLVLLYTHRTHSWIQAIISPVCCKRSS